MDWWMCERERVREGAEKDRSGQKVKQTVTEVLVVWP